MDHQMTNISSTGINSDVTVNANGSTTNSEIFSTSYSGSGLLKLTPYMRETLWGGTFFTKLHNLDPKSKIGESWELAMFDSESGPEQTLLYGKSINDFIGESNKYKFWGPSGKNSYVVKYLDANSNISVQVHPDDLWSKKHGHLKGKSECWIILSNEPQAGLYLGIKDEITYNDFEHAVKSNQDLRRFLNFIEVKKGDFFMIPAGVIHAMGKGVRLLEVQQNSNITYRLWDWNRISKNGIPRELHIDKGLEVISSNIHLNYLHNILTKEDIFIENNKQNLIVEHIDFTIESLVLNKDQIYNISLEKNNSRPISILCLKGETEISRGEEKISCKAYETILLPHNCFPQIIQISSKQSCELIIIS